MSGLNDAILGGVSAARDLIEDLMKDCTWTFVSTDLSSYNPTTDSMITDTQDLDFKILLYGEKESSENNQFSSRGMFVESMVATDDTSGIIFTRDIGDYIPGGKDIFVVHLQNGTDISYRVTGLQPVPGDSIYMFTAAITKDAI